MAGLRLFDVLCSTASPGCVLHVFDIRTDDFVTIRHWFAQAQRWIR